MLKKYPIWWTLNKRYTWKCSDTFPSASYSIKNRKLVPCGLLHNLLNFSKLYLYLYGCNAVFAFKPCCNPIVSAACISYIFPCHSFSNKYHSFCYTLFTLDSISVAHFVNTMFSLTKLAQLIYSEIMNVHLCFRRNLRTTEVFILTCCCYFPDKKRPLYYVCLHSYIRVCLTSLWSNIYEVVAKMSLLRAIVR